MCKGKVRLVGMLMAGLLGLTATAWADPGDVAVTVKEMATGKGISGVKLSVRTGGARGDYFTVDDGTASVPMPENAPYITISASAEGWVPVTQAWSKRGVAAKRPEKFELVLEKAAGISGTLVDEAGKPLSGGKVFCVVDKKYPNGQRLGASWTSATVDADGKWAFAGVPESFDKIQLGAYHKECLGNEGYYTLEDYADIAGLKKGTATLKLTRGTPVTVTVTDANGKPIRNARVAYGQDRVASNVYPEEKTDAKGVATMGIVAGAQAVITVQAKSHAPELVRVTIGNTPQAVNIKLTVGNKLEGTVTDDLGDAAAGATVYVDTWRGARTLNKSIKVDAEGHFAWTEAPADEVKVDVLTAHGEKRGVSMKVGDENKVVLTPPTPFKGTVVDAETGKPVTAYTVALGIAFDPQSPISWEMGEMSMREVHQDGGSFDVLFSYPYPNRAVRVIADGYLPSDSTRFAMEGKEIAFTFKLEKGQSIRGSVLGVDGKPLAGATVVMVTTGNNTQVQNGRLEEGMLRNALTAKTGPDGMFSLPPQKDLYALAVVTDDGAAKANQADFEKDKTLRLKAWGRIDGVVRHGTKPVAQAKVTAQHQDPPREMDNREPRISFFYYGKSDAEGKFSFDRVLPGTVGVSEEVMISDHMSIYAEYAEQPIESGKTAEVLLGGRGRPVKGRVEIPAAIVASGYQFGFNQLTPVAQQSIRKYPIEAYTLPMKDRAAWYKKWIQTDEGKAMLAEEKGGGMRLRSRSIVVKTDGTFEISDVPEGSYNLSVNITSPDPENRWNGKPLGSFQARVVVPAVPGGVSDEPLDVGTLTLQKPFRGVVGDEQPDITVKTAGGDEWRLSKQHGKVVVMYLFACKADDASNHLSQFQAVSDAYGKDPRFTMIGIDIGGDPATLTKFVADHHVGWTTGQMADADLLPVLQHFGFNGLPSAWIIDADGKIVVKDLDPGAMQAEVDKAMKK